MEVKPQVIAPRAAVSKPFHGLTLVRSHKPEISESNARPNSALFSPREMRHEFAIGAPKTAADSRRLRLYHCIRCKQSFRVDDRWGSVAPLDQNGNLLQGREALERLATFGQGPCPAFGRLVEAPRLTRPLAPGATFRGRLVALIALAWAWIQSSSLSRQSMRPVRRRVRQARVRRRSRTPAAASKSIGERK